METAKARLQRILGEGAPATSYVCFLPFYGEFGWYLLMHVKRVHAYIHARKLVFAKRGHECLFPTAERFFYDWQDVGDDVKAGVVDAPRGQAEQLRERVWSELGTKDVLFVDPADMSWDEKSSMGPYGFVPQALQPRGLRADVAIGPRRRVIDLHRNWTRENWQFVIDGLRSAGRTVAACGAASTSFALDGLAYRASDYVDVDADVELMHAARLVVVQESGLQYLAFACKRPVFCIDHAHPEIADLHRDHAVPYRALGPFVWHDPARLVAEILAFLG